MKFIAIYVMYNTRQARYGGAEYSAPLPAVLLHIFVMPLYDDTGFVASISYNGETYTYEYDSLGRLTKENSTQYEYDNKNNLIKKTAGGVVTNYTYDSYNRLTSDGTNDYTYDAMGNPVIYKGNTFTWEQGRKLASGSMNGNNFTYNYDGNGMRYKMDKRFICQKDLIVEGAIEGFEKLFEDKIVRKHQTKD